MKYLAHVLLLALLSCAGCESLYTVRVNEAVVYTPGPRQPGEGVLEDANLQGCLNQVLQGEEDADPGTLTTLACPSAGIRSLRGIDALDALQQIELSGNDISELGPLAALRDLRVLNLRNNDLRGITPLLDLPILRFVSLAGNPRIPCAQLDRLQEKLGNSLERPAECAG